MADFTISPGIVTNEIDQSVRATAVSTGSVAGLIGEFNWGPAMIPTMIKDEVELIDKFGTPTNENYIEWFNGKNYLEYASDLNVVRVVDTGSATNATFAENNPVYCPNESYYTEKLIAEEGGLRDSSIPGISTGTNANPIFGMNVGYGGWAALYPGTRGNSLRVEMCFATERSHTLGMRDAANTSLHINQIELTQNTASGITDNRYIIKFQNNDAVSNTTINFMDSVAGYFESRTDILATDTQTNQEKVLTFTRNAVTYNMLIESQRPDGTAIGFVNKGDGTMSMGNTVVISFATADGSDDLKELTVRERSMFEEFSVGAGRNNQDNLLGKVYYSVNSQIIYGVGTAFERQIAVGDKIEVSSQSKKVTSIESNTQLTVESPMSGSTYKQNSAGDWIANPQPWIRKWRWRESFTSEPATSNYARRMNNNDMLGNYNDQMHMVVVDSDGGASGVQENILESYAFLSLAKDGKDDNKVPNYYVNRVNSNSNWVRWTNHIIDNVAGSDSNWGQSVAGTKFLTYNKNSGILGRTYAASSFSGGTNGSAVDDEAVRKAIFIFKSKELWELDFFLVGWTNTEIDYQIAASNMIQVAEERKDCVVCVSGEYYKIVLGQPDSEGITDSFVGWRQGVNSSSYGIMDGNFKFQYDNYNDTYRWLPLSGDIAGLMGRTDKEYQPWYSPAGYRRGSIKNLVKLAFNPSQSERDLLYTSQINPVITIRGEGTMLFGDKTLQQIASAFDRINVRRLFIEVKDFVVRQARLRLFEFNTPATRASFKRQINNYLDFVQTEEGLSDYRVICDETNNTNAIIEENRFVADIYIKPTYVINFIKLNFTAVGQSVEFEDLGV